MLLPKVAAEPSPRHPIPAVPPQRRAPRNTTLTVIDATLPLLRVAGLAMVAPGPALASLPSRWLTRAEPSVFRKERSFPSAAIVPMSPMPRMDRAQYV